MAFASELVFKSSLLLVLAHLTCAGSNLRGVPNPAERVSIEEVQQSLLLEIQDALKTNDAHQGSTIEDFESELSAMFSALPKNEEGSLGHSTVHYALHRFFMERHGWFFKGLEPAGAAWSSLSPAGILKDRVPAYIQRLFEEQLGGQGFALRELAVLAATLEHLVNNEAKEGLRQTFQSLGLPVEGKLSKEKFDEALDIYMVARIMKSNFSALNLGETAEDQKKAQELFPDLLQIQAVVRASVAHSNFSINDEPSFGAASFVASESGKRLGLWHKGKCQSRKEHLISLGDQAVGRIPLSSFYAAALSRSNQHVSHSTEHIDYLRELGALDESVPKKTSVLLTNYLTSPANCFAPSSFYSICCPNECESLLRHLELEIAAPGAKPARIQKLIANLPSSTVSSPRELPAALLERLEKIAAMHGGDVPIHGRLFAQWLHHAYPRECPYPHTAGTTRPQTADEWMADTGKESTHTREEMEQFVKTAAKLEVSGDGDVTSPVVLPWSDDEELLVVRHESSATSLVLAPESAKQGQPLKIIRCIFFVLVLAMMCWLIQQKIAGLVGIARTTVGKGLKAQRGDKDCAPERYTD